jgi:hypothetical protein
MINHIFYQHRIKNKIYHIYEQKLASDYNYEVR